MERTPQPVRHQPPPRHQASERPGESHGDRHQSDGMVAMARENERAHLAPAPGADAPMPQPFPPIVLQGLVLGGLAGAVVGLVAGALLLNRVLVVPGWEQLYSMTPGTFVTFWLGMGVALGLLLGGVGTILMATPGPPAAQSPPERTGNGSARAEEPAARAPHLSNGHDTTGATG